MGDLPGIRSRLPYLRQLGIDAVWLTPFYPSPQADAGYDVANYRDVDPRFGTLADFDGLVANARPRHPSDRRHRAEPRPAPRGSRPRWRRSQAARGALLLLLMVRRPTVTSRRTTGGAASAGRHGRGWWTATVDPASGTCTCSMPANRSRLDERRGAREFESILRFWFDRGIDGFHVDVAHGLAKDPDMPDLAGRFRPGPAPSGASLGSGRGPRRVPGVARSATRIRVSGSSSGRSGCTRRNRSPGTCGRVSCTQRSTSTSSWRRGMRPRVLVRSTAAWEPSSRSAAADMGALQPRCDSPRDAARRRRAGTPASASGSPADVRAARRRLRVPGRELGLEEVEDLPDEVVRTRRSTAPPGPARVETAAGCRFPGAAPSRRSTRTRPNRVASAARRMGDSHGRRGGR